MQTLTEIGSPDIPRAVQSSVAIQQQAPGTAFRDVISEAKRDGEALPQGGSNLPAEKPPEDEGSPATARDESQDIDEDGLLVQTGAPTWHMDTETGTGFANAWLQPATSVPLPGAQALEQAATTGTNPAAMGRVLQPILEPPALGDPGSRMDLPNPQVSSGTSPVMSGQVIGAVPPSDLSLLANSEPMQGAGDSELPAFQAMAAVSDGADTKLMLDPRLLEGAWRRLLGGDSDVRRGVPTVAAVPNPGVSDVLQSLVVSTTGDVVAAALEGMLPGQDGLDLLDQVDPGLDAALDPDFDELPLNLPSTGSLDGADLPDVAALPAEPRTIDSASRPIHQLLTVTGTPAWARELSDTMLMMISQEKDVVELRLNPGNLGTLEVRLESEDDKVKLEFFSQNGMTREAIDAALPRLRELLASGGIQLAGAHVSADSMRQGENGRPMVPAAAPLLAGDGGADDESGHHSLLQSLRRHDGRVDTFA